MFNRFSGRNKPCRRLVDPTTGADAGRYPGNYWTPFANRSEWRAALRQRNGIKHPRAHNYK